jgi:nucleoside 2-deoxyribosyltransferase
MSCRRSSYLAAPLFSEAERTFNLMLAEQLEPYCAVYLPQRDGLLLRDLREAGDDSSEARRRIYTTDIAAIRACDMLVAVLDGPSVDEGVSFELGYATCLGKTCVGLATDSRRATGYFRNPMWDCALQKVFYSIPELLEWASKLIANTEVPPGHAGAAPGAHNQSPIPSELID